MAKLEVAEEEATAQVVAIKAQTETAMGTKEPHPQYYPIRHLRSPSRLAAMAAAETTAREAEGVARMAVAFRGSESWEVASAAVAMWRAMRVEAEMALPPGMAAAVQEAAAMATVGSMEANKGVARSAAAAAAPSVSVLLATVLKVALKVPGTTEQAAPAVLEAAASLEVPLAMATTAEAGLAEALMASGLLAVATPVVAHREATMGKVAVQVAVWTVVAKLEVAHSVRAAQAASEAPVKEAAAGLAAAGSAVPVSS